jgi:branched-chain amino acid transport system ATP-binding protein
MRPVTEEAVAGDGQAARSTVLEATGVTVRFGGLTALDCVSVRVQASSVVGLVGPNGAGKSTLFGVLSGLLRPSCGTVELAGSDVTRQSPHARARRGLARTFQQPELFAGLTVREHLVLSHRVRHNRNRLWKDAFTGGSLRRASPEENQRVDELLDLLALTGVAHDVADTLPLGTSRLVEVGRALATSPLVVLLDEPLAGLDAHEAQRLAATLQLTVARELVALLLVEHDVGTVLKVSSHVYVLDFGVLIAEGPPDHVRSDPRVRAAYLGKDDIDVSRTGIGGPGRQR